MKGEKAVTIILLCVLIIFLVAAITFLSLFLTGCYSELSNKADFIGAILSFTGTILLGTITAFQTLKANELSELVFKDKVNCDLIPTDDVIITKVAFNTSVVKDFATKHETEGLYCEKDDGTYQYNNKDPYLKFRLSFKTAGSFLENCTVDNIYLNKSFNKEDSDLKNFYVKFKILNPRKKLILSYNPCDGLYYLEICMREDDILQKINDKGFFVIDLELKLTSSFSTARKMTYSLNFGKIVDLPKILNDGLTTKQKLTNVIVHRNNI